jgi:hypothetical protein
MKSPSGLLACLLAQDFFHITPMNLMVVLVHFLVLEIDSGSVLDWGA